MFARGAPAEHCDGITRTHDVRSAYDMDPTAPLWVLLVPQTLAHSDMSAPAWA